MQKILAHYELFKMVVDVPRGIVECSVFKGSGLYTWTKLMRLFRPNNEGGIVGFDFFEADRTTEFQFQQDKDCLDEHETRWTPQDILKKNCANWSFDKLVLVAGNVMQATKAYVIENLGVRMPLLNIEVDTYESPLACLENLYAIACTVGLVVFDEYTVRIYGESNAVDEYFKGKNIRLRNLSWANTPSAHIIKENF